MLQNVTVGKNPTAGGTGPTAGGTDPTVGPNVTKCHCGKKSSCSWLHPPHPPAPRASPAAARHRQPQQTPYLGEFAKTPESAATSLELLFSATTLWAAIPQQAPSADAIPTHRDAHVSIAPHPRKEIPTHSSLLAAPALSRTSQGIFRSCIRLGGEKSQETTQPPPSNRAFWCPRGAPKTRKGALRPARPKTRPKACPARPGLLQCTLTRAQASPPPARRYLRASAAADVDGERPAIASLHRQHQIPAAAHLPPTTTISLTT